jgi:hypothetical protein
LPFCETPLSRVLTNLTPAQREDLKDEFSRLCMHLKPHPRCRYLGIAGRLLLDFQFPKSSRLVCDFLRKLCFMYTWSGNFAATCGILAIIRLQ